MIGVYVRHLEDWHSPALWIVNPPEARSQAEHILTHQMRVIRDLKLAVSSLTLTHEHVDRRRVLPLPL